MNEQDQELTAQLEERADYIPLDRLEQETVVTDFYETVHRKLIHTGTKLLSGPRGCGKTHLMRYTYLRCQKQSTLPFAVYASFNRYYRLEPLLQRKPSAVATFHTWVLAVILRALAESVRDFDIPSRETTFEQVVGMSADELRNIISKIERGQQLEEFEAADARQISIPFVQDALRYFTEKAGRTRVILLLDDAALTLTREYLHDFFDLVRSIKTSSITPKASVYPGTTEYGPNFHAAQEAETVNVWLSPDDQSYASTMQQIAQLRISGFSSIPVDVAKYLMYAAFGVPRAFLMLLRGFQQSSGGTTQAIVNRLIQEHATARVSEYSSLRLKMPKLASIIEAGGTIFSRLVSALKDFNDNVDANGGKMTMVVGVQGTEDNAPVERIFSLLIEAGLLHELPSVSHGEGRIYRRFIINLAVLLNDRVFSTKTRGTSFKAIVEVIESDQTSKHPVRRSVSTLVGKELQDKLHPDLPACTRCHTERLSTNQKFCHNCGAELVDVSAFD